jgi:hypothetical protein
VELHVVTLAPIPALPAVTEAEFSFIALSILPTVGLTDAIPMPPSAR